MSRSAEKVGPAEFPDIWILGCAVSCAKIRASFKGLPEDHTCTPGGTDCQFEDFAHDKVRDHSGTWTSQICVDLSLPSGKDRHSHRLVVELERSMNRAELEAKLPMEMPAELRKDFGKYLDEPTVLLLFADAY